MHFWLIEDLIELSAREEEMEQQEVAYIFVLFVEEARRAEAAGVGAPDIWHSVRYYGGPHNVGGTLEKVLLTLLLSDNAQKGAWVVRNDGQKELHGIWSQVNY